MKNRTLLLILFALAWHGLMTSSAQAETSLSGQWLLAADSKAASLNFGGPNFRWNWAESRSMGLSFYPSLRRDWSEKVIPSLGAGPFVEIQRFVLAAPAYFVDGQWVHGVGLGYRF